MTVCESLDKEGHHWACMLRPKLYSATEIGRRALACQGRKPSEPIRTCTFTLSGADLSAPQTASKPPASRRSSTVEILPGRRGGEAPSPTLRSLISAPMAAAATRA